VVAMGLLFEVAGWALGCWTGGVRARFSGVDAQQVTYGGRFSGTHRLKAEKGGQRYATWVCPLREMVITEVRTPAGRSASQDDLVG
jgi:hypothetical protein